RCRCESGLSRCPAHLARRHRSAGRAAPSVPGPRSGPGADRARDWRRLLPAVGCRRHRARDLLPRRRSVLHRDPAGARAAAGGARVPAVPLRAEHGAVLRRAARARAAEGARMSYLILCAGFLLAAIVVAMIVRRRDTAPSLGATAVAAVIVLALTAVFDNVMIAAGLFAYSDAHISGIRIGAAPIEDFAYPLAAVILLPALWSRLGRTHDR